jgi:hypothetical protein
MFWFIRLIKQTKIGQSDHDFGTLKSHNFPIIIIINSTKRQGEGIQMIREKEKAEHNTCFQNVVLVLSKTGNNRK